MFKDLKVVKIIFFLILAGFIVNSQLNEHKNTEFIFNPTAYANQDALSFLVTSTTAIKKYQITITNSILDKVIFDSTLAIPKTYDYFNQLNFLSDGYPSERQTIAGLSLPAGIYTVNEQNPFVVSNRSQSDITVVFPIVSNLFYKEENKLRIFESSQSYVSSNRPVALDVWTKGMLSFFSQLAAAYTTNYITDLDLEDASYLAQTKVLVLYGDLVFWSPKMVKNVEDFIANGGNVLIASSEIFYGRFCFNAIENKLQLDACASFNAELNSKIQSWNTSPKDINYLEMRTFFHSNFGGKNSSRKGVKINQLQHPIFQGLALEKLELALDIGEHYVGVPNVPVDSETYLQRKFFLLTVLAETACENEGRTNNIGGVFEYQKENGGKAIILGTSDYCLKENQDNKTINQLFVNSINYLLHR